jgi:hypothetical protein
VSSIDGFDRQLRDTVAFAHDDCTCERCIERQRDDTWRIAKRRALTDELDQLDWLAEHESDGLAGVLRGLLDRVTDEGLDLTGFREDVDREWPIQHPRKR